MLRISCLCADARSFETIASELAHCYGGAVESELASPVQYADAAALLNDLESSAPEPSEEVDEGRPGPSSARVASAQGARGPADPRWVACGLTSLLPKLDELAETWGVEWSTLLASGWQMLDARSGQADVVVTDVAADKRFEGTGASSVGPYATPLPLATPIRATDRCVDIARAVHAAYARLRDSDDGGLLAGQDDASLGERPRAAVEWQVVAPHVASDGPSFVLRRWGGCLAARGELVSFVRGRASLDAVLHFDAASSAPDAAARRFERLKVLLEGLLARPAALVAELPIVGPRERHSLLVEWNETEPIESSARCIHEVVAEWAGRQPNAIAATFRGDALTYAELHARAGQLAEHLRARGVGRESRVAICIDRNLTLPVCVLGVLQAGAAFVPIDPHLPPERAAFIVGNAGCTLVLTNARCRDSLVRCSVPAVDVETDLQPCDLASRDRARAASPRNLAYVIYTSGSTGRPKGVM
ncbi:MAG: AMP-binding protein, partial [Gammaproteobacteria bacterium]